MSRNYPYLSQEEQDRLNALRKSAIHENRDIAEFYGEEPDAAPIEVADVADFIALALMKETAVLVNLLSSNHREELQGLKQIEEATKSLASLESCRCLPGESKKPALAGVLVRGVRKYAPRLKERLSRVRDLSARAGRP